MKSFKIERIHSTAMYEKNICGTRSKFLVLRQIGKLFEIQQSYPIEMDSCYYSFPFITIFPNPPKT